MFFIGNHSNKTVRIIRLMWQLNTRMQLRHTGMAITVFYVRFVKIIREKNGNFDLALQKRRFCVAKEPLLQHKSVGIVSRLCFPLQIVVALRANYTCI